jgi:hypothetical protein
MTKCLGGLFWLGVVLNLGCTEAPQAASPAPADAPAAAPAAPVEETPLQKSSKLTTFAEARDFAKPYMSDVVNEPSEGALIFAAWAFGHLKLDDVLVAKDETTFALVQKDPDEERGKRVCYGGTIIQIEVVKTPFGKGYDGILMNQRGDLFKFLVAGKTGALVARSWGRVCGVVIGKYQYSNSGGGTGHAVQLVGMFDLPENRAGERSAPNPQ